MTTESLPRRRTDELDEDDTTGGMPGEQSGEIQDLQ